MKNVGFLGCGKIGRTMMDDIIENGVHKVVFVQDPFYTAENAPYEITKKAGEELLSKTDLVIEAAMASVLKENFDDIIKYCDLMVFSVTAFSDDEFYRHAVEMAKKYKRTIYLPHGAILGVDGIADGREIIRNVTIVTTKSPKSLGLDSDKLEVVYEGSTRGACSAFPRNVNVHATVALAGIGFDRTCSKIIADPSVNTNAHVIHVEGEGIDFEIHVSSTAGGAVTGKYTPYSAVASMHKVLGDHTEFRFV
ncbi:MAG: aspartate dehydrogenase domain-containing protein [Candidatus Alectryocaccobium sp.]|jgi:aspartate dehydrogenase